MRKKLVLIMSIVMLVCIMTGCWDNIEIDERAYVLAIGIDKVPKDENEKMLFYFAFPNVQIAAGGGADISNIVTRRKGKSFYCTQEKLTARVDKKLFMGHLKVIIIGEEIAENPNKIREILDAFERDPLISRKVRVAIAKGEAKDILETEAETESLIGLFIGGLFRTRERMHGYDTGELGKILKRMHQYGKVAIPSISVVNKEVILEGKAVFNKYELVGWLDEMDKQILMMIREEAYGLSIPILHDEAIIPYCITDVKVKFNLQDEKEQIRIMIEIDVEGDIKQYLFNPKEDIVSPKFIEEVDKKINKTLELKTKKLINRIQEEMKTDVLGVQSYLEKFYPKVWEREKEDWNETFPNLDIDIKINAKVRRLGLSR
ncbi:MAG: Ger(x)C family spore germination protein [Alkaliphilus sp.]